MNFQQDYNLLPHDLELHWDGFSGTLTSLMQAGWSIEARKDPALFEVQLILRQKRLDLYGASVGMYDYIGWREMFRPRDFGSPESVAVRVDIAKNITYHVHGRIEATSWMSGEDSRPVIPSMMVDNEIVLLRDLFSKGNEPEEIVVETRPDVIQLLNQIKDLQEPRAKELLAEQRRKSRVESFETMANVIALK